MNIIIFSPTNEGTIAKCSASLFEALKNNEKCNVKLLTLYKYAEGEQIFADCEYLIDRMVDETANCSYWKKIKWLRSQKRKFNAHLTVSTLNATSLLNVLSFGNGKTIGIFHAPKVQAKAFGKIHYFLTILAYYFIFPFLDKCFCVSQESKQDLESVSTIKRNKIEVVYNIYNIDRIKSLSTDNLDNTYAEIFSNPVVLYCGRLDENKAPIRAIDALSYVKDKSLHLVIIGPDPYNIWEDIKCRIPADIKNRIHYLGPQKNPYKFISRSRILVSCSYSEGLPGVIIEALALKVPVVATNSSQGIWEILSCYQYYDLSLSSMSMFDDGIITSNLSYRNKEKYETDIINLSAAIDILLVRSLPLSFRFAKEINSESVITKYINI